MTDRGEEAVSAPLSPHRYDPDLALAGDCSECGHIRDSPLHIGTDAYWAAQVAEARAAGIRDGYLAGFMVSSEGWNGEHGVKTYPVENDPHWLEIRDEDIALLLDEKEGR